jgi:hypothetical protein
MYDCYKDRLRRELTLLDIHLSPEPLEKRRGGHPGLRRPLPRSLPLPPVPCMRIESVIV